ncbi:MAG: DUF2088 domain-containing protein [Proteobacteria bacterium]|nr:DUF2088 domain-containing protein [Pseudomonadota bacterium]MBU4471282.1 DUF2088 domain-containing protein [Pseudomonadota bacterium]MCG2753902.1 hypothetical protein [Desulfobacteraceae bacterium]
MNLFRIHQNLVSNPLADIASTVYRELDRLKMEVPKGEVAITAGSRGIDHIAEITKAVGDWLNQKGARPFIVPCMGSHNGATAKGQRAMVESLGITEKAMGMEIRSSMDVVKIGSVASGEVFMDQHCHGAAGVMVLNRIKLHTAFSGPVQSGLMKMMVVGMGKIKSAQTFHDAPSGQMKDMLMDMGRLILSSGKILAGLAILEDGFDRTAEIHAVRPEELLRREAELLERHRQYFPGLPVSDMNVLVVDAMGKTYSGTGMDTNVIGYRGMKGQEDLETPKIKIIAALSLSEASLGNAIGVGLADVITRRLRNAVDEEKTFINAFTTGEMQRAKIPATLADDEVLISKLRERFGDRRWMFIPNTLHLETLYVSEDLLPEITLNPLCKADPDPVALGFYGGRHQLKF